MTEVLNFLQNDPFAIVIIATVALLLALVIIFPTFLSYLTKLKIPLKRPKSEPIKEEKEDKAEQPSKPAQKKFQFVLPSFNVKDFKLKSPKTAVIGGAVVVALLFVAYVSYDFFFRPVRIINAWQLKLEQGGKIAKLQESDRLSYWTEAGIYLLDIRSRDSYAEEHLKNSSSLPANRVKNEQYPLEGIPIVVYTTKFNFEDARNAAEEIVKNGKDGRVDYENPGKIYVIKDGYEALKGVGLKTESGEWD